MSDDRIELPTDRQQEDDGEDAPEVFVLTVVEGPARGAQITIDPASPARALLGKGITATLRLDDGEVSRRHLSIRPQGKVLVLADLGSTNGTLVNGVSVREATLRGGEALRLGRTVLSVTRGAPSHVALPAEPAFGRLLGESRAMRILYPTLRRLATLDHPLLVEGEAGVGKELCAEEIHAHSSRAARPFVALDCQSLAPGALEARLFAAGGLVEQASGGTVFVDEVAALPLRVQRRLVGDLDQAPVRFVFGTARDLDEDVGEGTFSEALLVRLAPTRVNLPPLRERAGDVSLLARAFWSTLAAEGAARGEPAPESKELPADFLARFHRYRWPGNVRELSRAVSARFNTGAFVEWRWTGPAVSSAERDFLRAVVDRELPLADARQAVVDELERRYVDHMLARHGSTRDAAAASGVGVRYFQLLRARFEI